MKTPSSSPSGLLQRRTTALPALRRGSRSNSGTLTRPWSLNLRSSSSPSIDRRTQTTSPPPGHTAGARYEAESSVASHRQRAWSVSTATTPRRIPWKTATVRSRRSGSHAGGPQIRNSRGSTRCQAPSLPTNSEYQGGYSVSLWSRAISCPGPKAASHVAPGSSGVRSRASPRAGNSSSRRSGSTSLRAGRYVSTITSPAFPVVSEDTLVPGERSASRTGGAPSSASRQILRCSAGGASYSRAECDGARPSSGGKCVVASAKPPPVHAAWITSEAPGGSACDLPATEIIPPWSTTARRSPPGSGHAMPVPRATIASDAQSRTSHRSGYWTTTPLQPQARMRRTRGTRLVGSPRQLTRHNVRQTPSG